MSSSTACRTRRCSRVHLHADGEHGTRRRVSRGDLRCGRQRVESSTHQVLHQTVTDDDGLRQRRVGVPVRLVPSQQRLSVGGPGSAYELDTLIPMILSILIRLRGHRLPQQAGRWHNGTRSRAAKQHSFIRSRRSSADRKMGVHFLSSVGQLRKLHNFRTCAFQ